MLLDGEKIDVFCAAVLCFLSGERLNKCADEYVLVWQLNHDKFQQKDHKADGQTDGQTVVNYHAIYSRQCAVRAHPPADNVPSRHPAPISL